MTRLTLKSSARRVVALFVTFKNKTQTIFLNDDQIKGKKERGDPLLSDAPDSVFV